MYITIYMKKILKLNFFQTKRTTGASQVREFEKLLDAMFFFIWLNTFLKILFYFSIPWLSWSAEGRWWTSVRDTDSPGGRGSQPGVRVRGREPRAAALLARGGGRNPAQPPAGRRQGPLRPLDLRVPSHPARLKVR